MSCQIHPTSLVHPDARLGENVAIGPFCVVGPLVSLGDRCVLRSHVNLEGNTRVGPDNVFFPFCSVGAPPQDLKYKGENTELILGSGNTIRESVTLQPGTVQGGGKTVIGDRNLFMAYSHVAHDCIIGSENIFANAVQLSGHVSVENQAVLGGMSAVHQFCRIGDLAMLGGGAMLVKDAPPFSLVQGDHASFRGLNAIGLRRRGFSLAEIEAIKRAYQFLIWDPRPTVEESIASFEAELGSDQGGQQGNLAVVEKIVSFFRASERGVVRKNDKS
jgi:UDP-N-acetylglucosamine acyltransferase